MQFKTHLAFSLLLALLLVYLGLAKPSVILFASFLFFSLLPDIDTPESFVGRMIQPFSNIIKAAVGHRTIFHSIWLPAIIYIVCLPFSRTLAIAASVGYLSHIIIDMGNEKGIKPLWPINIHINGPFRTGGFFEILIFVILLGIDFFFLLKLL